jgi:hypothetical protein
VANPENIRPPVKGEIRNPNGRGKGVKNRSTILKKWIEVAAKIKHPETEQDMPGTFEDKVVMALVTKALAGDVPAIKEIMDTLYGKLTDKTDITSDGDRINVTFSSK